jgi:site-specific recombinase XerD
VRAYQRHLTTKTGRDGVAPLKSETLLGCAKQLHAFLVWCEEEEMATGLSKRVVMPRKDSLVLRTLTPTEVAALLDAAGQGQLRERDRAIVACLVDTGVRASELCGLRLEDIHADDDGAWLLIRGKGRKERLVALGGLSRRLLVRYTQEIPTPPRRPRHGFPDALWKGDRYQHSGRTPQAPSQGCRGVGGLSALLPEDLRCPIPHTGR